MKQVMKITTIISLCFILIGIGLAGCGYMLGGNIHWAYLPSSNRFFTEKNAKHKIVKEDLDAFSNIDLTNDYYDIVITQGDSYSLSYPKYSNIHTTYSVKDDTLTLTSKSESTIGFSLTGNSFSDYALVLTVPSKQALKHITLKSNSGDFELSDLTCDEIQAAVNYGDITISNLSGSSLDLKADSGDIELSHTELTASNLTLNYGDCDIQSSTISRLQVTNDCGDLSTEKFTCDEATFTSHYGDIDLESTTVKNLTAALDSGDCDLELIGAKEDYSIDLSSDTDDVEVDDDDADNHYNYVSSTSNTIKVEANYGSISLDFTH